MSLCDTCHWLGREFEHLKDYEEEGATWYDCSIPIPYWATPRAVRKKFIDRCPCWNAEIKLIKDKEKWPQEYRSKNK